MKKSIISLGLVIGMLSMASFAAESANSPVGSGSSLGVVTVQGALTVDQVEQQLAEKAASAGAKSYYITAIGGKDKLFGVAQIYR